VATAQIPCSPALFGLTSESRIAELAHFENREGGSSLKEAHVVQNLLDVDEAAQGAAASYFPAKLRR
jgi:hypothetical protein